MRIQKRVGAWTLVLCLLLGMIPTYAGAADSGTCGDNVTYVFDDAGTLTISGTGGMTNYDTASAAPWNDYRASITSVTVESGVTSVGSHAFNGCANLTEVSLPNGLTTVGYSAFRDCASLTGVALPDTVTTIEGDAFRSSGLQDMWIPSGVTLISDNAFMNCANLRTMRIPVSVTSVGSYAFSGCSALTDVYYQGTAQQWSNVSMDDGNEALTSATLHYSDEAGDWNGSGMTTTTLASVSIASSRATAYDTSSTAITSGITWSVTPANGGVTINAEGRLTVATTATAQEYTVTATPDSTGTVTGNAQSAKFAVTRMYTIKFAANGGSNTMSDVTVQTSPYTLPENGFAPPDGMKFKAWGVNGTEYASGTAVDLDTNTTLKNTSDGVELSGEMTVTAVWEEDIPAVTLDHVTLNPASVTLDGTNSASVAASAIGSDNNAFTSGVTWSVTPSGGGVEITNETAGEIGIAATATAGDYTVTATYENVSASAMLTVTRAITLASVVLNPTSVTLDGTNGANVTASAIGSDNNAFTSGVTWSVTPANSGVAINATSGVISIASSATAGEYTVTATYNNVSTSKTLIVTRANSIATSITIFGGQTSVEIPSDGQQAVSTEPFSSTVLDQFGAVMPNASVIWTITAPDNESLPGVTVSDGVVTVSNEAKKNIGASGVSMTVRATSGNASATANVLVRRATSVVSKVQLDGADSPDSFGNVVTVLVKDNTSIVVASSALDQYGAGLSGVTWSVTPANSGVTINATSGAISIASSATAGDYTVTATYNGVSASATLTVTQAITLASVTLNPSSVTLDGTNGASVTASAIGSDNNLITSGVTWSVTPTNSGVTIDATSGTIAMIAIVANAKTGDYTVTGTYNGTSQSATLIVSRNAMLDHVTLNPLTVTLDGTNGASVTASALGSDNNAITSGITWDISPDINGVTIDANGVITIDANATAQSYTVTATQNYFLAETYDIILRNATFNVTRNPSYTVTFDANGGTNTMNPVTVSDNSYTLPQNGFMPPSRMIFGAWSVNGAEYAPGETISLSENVNVTAVWVNPYRMLDHLQDMDSYVDQTWHLAGPLSEFQTLNIDDTALTQVDDYTAEDGSTKLNIPAGTFARFGEGTHSIAATFQTTPDSNDPGDDGRRVTSDYYTVKPKGKVTIDASEINGADATQAVRGVSYTNRFYTSPRLNDVYFRMSVINGTIPAGLTFHDGGYFTGTPLTAGQSCTFTVGLQIRSNVTDAWPETYEDTVEVTIVVEQDTQANVQTSEDPGYELVERIPATIEVDTIGEVVHLTSKGPFEEFTDFYIDGVKKIRNVDYTVRPCLIDPVTGDVLRLLDGGAITGTFIQLQKSQLSLGTHSLNLEFVKTDSIGNKQVRNASQKVTVTQKTTPVVVSTGGGGGGSSSGASYYSVKASKPAHGSISLSAASVAAGKTVTVTVTPDKGYQIKGVSAVDSKKVNVKLTQNGNKYTFTMPKRTVTVSATFEPSAYTVSASQTQHGKITLNSATASPGAVVNGSTTPDKGYRLSVVRVLDSSGKSVNVEMFNDGKFTFLMPSSKVTVSATFEPSVYAVSASQAQHGKITLNSSTASVGATVNGSTTPDKGYLLSGVTVRDDNGNTVKAEAFNDGKFTFLMPSSKVTVSATFTVKRLASFVDIQGSDWFFDDAEWAYNKSILRGMTENYWEPQSLMSSVTMIVTLERLDGVDLTPYDTGADDGIDNNAWYASAQRWARDNNILLKDRAFGEREAMTRGECAVMLTNYLRYRGLNVTPKSEFAFTDAEQLTPDELNAFRLLRDADVFRGYGDGAVRPKTYLSRAHLSALLHRLSSHIIKEETADGNINPVVMPTQVRN